MSGCTLFGEKNPPTLKSTTSAEQYERLYWAAVKAKQWPKLPGFLAANTAYSADGKLMNKQQAVAYLQAMQLTDFSITGLSVKPNGPDMTLTYTLQRSAAGATETVTAISVWQQVSGGYILTVHSEQR